MKKIIILMILLMIPLVNSFTEEQKKQLEKTLDAVNTNSDFEKVMNLLNNQNIDLSNEKNTVDKINSLAERFDVNLADYPNVNGLGVEFPKEVKTTEKEKGKIKINWILIIVIFISIFVLIFEVYRFKNTKAEEIQEPQEEQLRNYIKDAIEKGYAKEEIKKILIENNWDKNIIDDVLRNF